MRAHGHARLEDRVGHAREGVDLAAFAQRRPAFQGNERVDDDVFGDLDLRSDLGAERRRVEAVDGLHQAFCFVAGFLEFICRNGICNDAAGL